MGGVYGNAIAMALENAPVEVSTVLKPVVHLVTILGYALTESPNRLEDSCPEFCSKDIR